MLDYPFHNTITELSSCSGDLDQHINPSLLLSWPGLGNPLLFSNLFSTGGGVYWSLGDCEETEILQHVTAIVDILFIPSIGIVLQGHSTAKPEFYRSPFTMAWRFQPSCRAGNLQQLGALVGWPKLCRISSEKSVVGPTVKLVHYWKRGRWSW